MALTTAVYRELEYDLRQLVSDTTDDPDDLPDELPITGDVIITPLIPQIDGSIGRELRFVGETPRAKKVSVADTVCSIVDGILTYNGLPRVQALTTDNINVNPVAWRYRLTHLNMRQGSTPVTFKDFEFQVPDGVGPLDLTRATPLAITGATFTLQGPPGEASAVDNGDGSYTLVSSAGGGNGTGEVDTINNITPGIDGNVTLTTDNIPSGTTTKQYTAAEKARLATIEDGANNVTDAEINALADGRINSSTTILKQSHLLAWGTRPEVWHTGTAWPADPRPITLPAGTYNGPLVAISKSLPTVTSAPTWLRNEDIWEAAP